jgi:endonuclease YncB( thermonuclease family)
MISPRPLIFGLILASAALSPALSKTQSPLPWVARNHLKPTPPVPPNVAPKVLAGPLDVVGTAHALSGDTIAVGTAIFRLWGIAAPAMNEFGGYTSMQGLIGLIDDQTVVCSPANLVVGGHQVGRCRVEDKDLSSIMVARGFARDCPRQSAGTYADLERQEISNVAGGFDLPQECLADY